jgi:nitroreductase
MLLDIGHVCQNLYLACEGIGCGTCAIAGYVQKPFDDLLRIDGENEYVVYISAVGKLE